jgi:alkylation response protein AidB-like acyl-CoA dehydrogenase
MSSDLAVIRAALYTCAQQWEAAATHDWDPDQVKRAEVLGLQALHVSKRVALNVTARVFDICGARASFRSFPFDMIYRDVRTFTLHHRDYDYMMRVATAVLDGSDKADLGSYLGTTWRTGVATG